MLQQTKSPRRALALLLAAAALLGSAGCGPAEADRPLIFVSTNILGDVVENVIGDQADVLTLMPPNADPHSLEISAQQAATMRQADLIVTNGLGLEEGLQRHVDAANSDGVPLLVAGDLIEALQYSEASAT